MIDNMKEDILSPELIERIKSLRGLKKNQLQAIADTINSMSDTEMKGPVIDALRTELLDTSIDIKKEEWSQEKDDLRCQLIDKFIQGDISTHEQLELNKLQQQAEEYFDKIAPPPMDGARKLHKELLKKQQLDK